MLTSNIEIQNTNIENDIDIEISENQLIRVNVNKESGYLTI